MRTLFILFIFVSLLIALKVNNKTKEKEFKEKEDVNLIFSSIYKPNLKFEKYHK